MFEFSSIERYHIALQERKFTCLDAVNFYLQQIEKHEHLNAFIEVFAEEARIRAKQLDEERESGSPPGKLHGVIVGIKDVIAFKDHRLSASSQILQNFTSIYSATAVEKLLKEGAIIIGNLNCDEFAMGSTNENSVYGNVLNAFDETKVPGGSSGGSAVAVQARLCMVSLGSDTGGSVRQPADFCGIIGFKPTYGRISRYGLIAYASSFDQIGIFSLNIPDVAILLEVIAGADEFDSTVSLQPVPTYSRELAPKKSYRFAFFEKALSHSGIDPEISSSIRKLIEQLENNGHTIESVPFDLLDFLVPAYYVLTTAEASSNLSRYDGVRYGYRDKEQDRDLTSFYKANRSKGFGKEVKRRIMLGTFVLSAGYYDAYYTKAQKVRALIAEKMKLIFSEFDFIILPTSPVTAFPIGEKLEDPIAMYLADIYTVMANLAGVPAVSLPLFKHSNGMPFGVQVMANQFDEVSLLQISDLLLQGYKQGQV